MSAFPRDGRSAGSGLRAPFALPCLLNPASLFFHVQPSDWMQITCPSAPLRAHCPLSVGNDPLSPLPLPLRLAALVSAHCPAAGTARGQSPWAGGRQLWGKPLSSPAVHRPAPQRPCGKGSGEIRAPPCSHPGRRPRPCSFEVAGGRRAFTNLQPGGGQAQAWGLQEEPSFLTLCPQRTHLPLEEGHAALERTWWGAQGTGPGAGLRSGGISRAAWTREQRWRHHFLAFGEPVIKDLKVQSPAPARGSVLGSAPPFQVLGPRALH